MNVIYKILILKSLLASVLFLSCVRDISIELPRPEQKLVVEAYIESDSFAVVFLTRSSAYFDVVDSLSVFNNIVWGNEATVIVSDGIEYDTLVPHNFDKFPFRGYKGQSIRGDVNGQYELKIVYNENSFSSLTTIPEKVPIDSVWFEAWFPDDSLGVFGLQWYDPPILGNYYSITAKVHGAQESFYRSFIVGHLLDDKLDNGRKIVFFPLFRPYDGNDYFGQERDTSLDIINYLFYKIKDTVSFKLASMDAMSYRFWNSWFRNQVTAGNPFANPSSVLTNIQGENVTGYWAGYASYIHRVYITDSTNIEILLSE